ncbi:TetR/AcrR family transcriptional regulator [Sphaerisporangium fuscum]|uniref:TetR/AcrR family transcriptional regulator n=1 Tax=Sphaerisporangium fuscum TaxID=2835868 RepID=UPI001BDDAAD7|nr:TetR/AcrR family transcriptional regulator [Sphaerisporangium fuscum]
MSAAGTVRPGGRTARTRAKVLQAALEEVGERGFDAVSVEDIAVRAGVHKTTVYRRWETKDRVVAEAFVEAIDSTIALTDTGDIRDDLRVIARTVLVTVQSTAVNAAVRTLMSGGHSSEHVRRFLLGFFDERLVQVTPVIQRAIERGQLPQGTDPVLLYKHAIGPLYYRHFIMADPLTPADAVMTADAALAAARAGTFVLPLASPEVPPSRATHT